MANQWLTAPPDVTDKDDHPSTRVLIQPFRDPVNRNPVQLFSMWPLCLPSVTDCGENRGESTSGDAVSFSFWSEAVHYSEEYVLFAQRAAMHHNEQRTSSPLMRTVQPENCTTPRADTRKPALVILADSDHRSLENPVRLSDSPPRGTAPPG